MLLSCGMFSCAYRCFLHPKSLVSYLYVDFQEPSRWSITKVFVASHRWVLYFNCVHELSFGQRGVFLIHALRTQVKCSLEDVINEMHLTFVAVFESILHNSPEEVCSQNSVPMPVALPYCSQVCTIYIRDEN